MSLSPEQSQLLGEIIASRQEALADYGTDSDTSSESDLIWAQRVDDLVSIIDSLTGGRHEVVIELFFGVEVASGTANGLLYGLGQEGVQFSAQEINAKLIELKGNAPLRLDLAATIRQIAARTPLYLRSEQNAKTSTRLLSEALSGINVVYLGQA